MLLCVGLFGSCCCLMFDVENPCRGRVPTARLDPRLGVMAISKSQMNVPRFDVSQTPERLRTIFDTDYRITEAE